MTTQPTPAEGTCGRCQQRRVVHPAKPNWGHVPKLLCTSCWQRYDEARANDDYVDWNDAFDNASDEEIVAHLATAKD
ncbi:hypothetical protein [Kitasatospora sp. NPDC059571]|uniref:hypothetical protein n=1 Tax=Kitasatospora sp. NPDC059571 TaxID=3346871 RepID=UPI00367D1416